MGLTEEATFAQRLEGGEGGSLMNICVRLFREEHGSLCGLLGEQQGGQCGWSGVCGVWSELRSEVPRSQLSKSLECHCQTSVLTLGEEGTGGS